MKPAFYKPEQTVSGAAYSQWFRAMASLVATARVVYGVSVIGIAYAGWLFPPRLVNRTGNSFTTFNGGTQEILIEFAKISLAFQVKR